MPRERRIDEIQLFSFHVAFLPKAACSHRREYHLPGRAVYRTHLSRGCCISLILYIPLPSLNLRIYMRACTWLARGQSTMKMMGFLELLALRTCLPPESKTFHLTGISLECALVLQRALFQLLTIGSTFLPSHAINGIESDPGCNSPRIKWPNSTNQRHEQWRIATHQPPHFFDNP